jgi:hypothetical protein
MNELTVRPNGIIHSFDDLERAAKAMAASGFFSDSQSAAQAVVKIMAGQEMGFGPFASMSGIYIIKGKPSVGANLIAAAVKSSGKYDYRVITLDDTGCEIAFYQADAEIGRSSFTAADAKKAGTQNTEKFPRNMYFARAMSNGAKWYCPDIFKTPIYTPEELGAVVDDGGNVVEGSFSQQSEKAILHNLDMKHAPDLPKSELQPPAKKPVKAEPVAVTITQAIIDAEMSSDGVTLYTSIPTPKLANMGNAMLKKLNAGEYTADELVEKSRKLAVIDAILIKRQEVG